MNDDVIDHLVESMRKGEAEGKSVKQVLDAVIEMISVLRDHLVTPDSESVLIAQGRSNSMSYMALAALLIKERAMRAHHLDQSLLGEPAWDMLLDLFHCREAGRTVSVSSLCIASCVPGTTALRYIAWLEEEDLIVRFKDQHDGRRMFLELTDEAYEKTAGYLDGVAHLRGISLYPSASASLVEPSAGAAHRPHRRR